jgi:hypothetical protein
MSSLTDIWIRNFNSITKIVLKHKSKNYKYKIIVINIMF